MRMCNPVTAGLCLFALLLTFGVSATDARAEVEVNEGFLAAFQPGLPEKYPNPDNPITEEKVDLGRMLYYDTRFSLSQKISCNSCHLLDKYGTDNDVSSVGHNGQRGGRGAPTVYNAAGHLAQFWDGRSPDVEDQAKGPVLNPIEMAMPSEAYVLEVINSIPGYVKAFKKAFPDDANPVNYDNWGKAIGAFERKLVTPAPFDKFLKGDKDALTDAQKKGFLTFMQTGCQACHNGPLLGGRLYQKLGLTKPWPGLEDLGRFAVTKNPADKHVFKVPSLRNIAKTGPYFHDGSAKTLDDAVKMMATHQLGRDLSDEQAASIVEFLKSLTGELPMDYIKKPKLPKSGPNTPGPK